MQVFSDSLDSTPLVFRPSRVCIHGIPLKKKSGAPTRVLRTSMGKHAFHWFPIKWNVETTWNSSQVVADAFWLMSFLGHFVKLKAPKLGRLNSGRSTQIPKKTWERYPRNESQISHPVKKKKNHWLKSADFGKRICLICWFPGGWWIPIFFPQFFITQINPSNNHNQVGPLYSLPVKVIGFENLASPPEVSKLVRGPKLPNEFWLWTML